MDNSKVRCLKCNTRGVPAHGAVSEEGSRRYSPVLLCLIGCRCGILWSFYRVEIGCIWGTLWGELCFCPKESKEKKTNFKIKGFKTVPRSCIMHSSLVNLSRGTKKRLEIALHIERACVAVTLWYKHVFFFLDFLTGVFYKMPKARGLESASKIKMCTAGGKKSIIKIWPRLHASNHDTSQHSCWTGRRCPVRLVKIC